MSSGWAPRARIRSGRPSPAPLSRSAITTRTAWSPEGIGLPERPRRSSRLPHLLEVLDVLEGVHRRPESVVLVGHQLVLLDQPPERLLDQLLARPDVVEDLTPEEEVAAVDPDIRRPHVVD